ncbi:sensor histidine kinase, HAMP and PAS domain-containing [Citrifermentans bemidjiense Bem]|uniref:histidine kinase n=1 Tax=Citrifermentans bemidjiense (strain ATCC BAA-1014 / DSM 16622 / JCM 12645 / Bem) TaxID=404380 RepID=B5E7Q4_CITBB|nr:ATP-binding protein [Citrifermentans bemidjiense]ACH37040.1 sensor histidine kinase, HAMP and PAS domain-containing [Citrifermentans bemidjiense Bem]
MQLRFGIRTKLLLSILAILFVSYSTLLYSSMKTLNASLQTELDRNLATNLKYARSQYLDQAEIAKFSMMQAVVSQTVQQRLRERDSAWFSTRIKRWHDVLPFVDLVVVVDPQEKVLATLQGPEKNGPMELPAMVKQALASKRAILSTELLSGEFMCRAGVPGYCERPGSEALVATVAVPVIGTDGSVLGCVVTGDILNHHPNLPGKLQEVTGNNVEVTLTQRGLRVASSLPARVRESYILSPKVLDVLERGEVYRGRTDMGAKSYETIIDPLLNSRGEFVGSLSVAISTETVTNSRRENLQYILASAFLGIICSFAMAYFASRHLTGPLRQLAMSARRIEEGDLDQRVVGHQRDEVGMLASSFNNMAESLKERDGIINKKTGDLQELNEQLEKMVEQRTSALSMEMGRLEAVLTSLAEGVVVTDRDNLVVLFNPAAQQLFELVPHRVVGQSVERLCEMTGFCNVLEQVSDKAQREPRCGKKEVTVKGKRLHVNTATLQDEAGEFAGMVMSLRDVTKEEQVDRMKTEFISTVSHELKTPLTSIKGSLQLLLTRSKWLTDTERQLLTVCFRNTQRLIRLISEILDISGIESGGMIFNFKPLCIGELAVYAVEEIKSLAMGREITIVNTVGEHLPMVFGDSDRLIQVMTNLLSNAVKFSPEGKVVMVTAEQEGNYVVVSVADRGRVIQWSDRDKLFKKFQQIESTERNKIGGTGLGLAICKEIVERHHGRIFYTAAKEYGNTFSFTVPIIGETDAKG